MHKKLKRNAVGLESKTQALYDQVIKEKAIIPPENLRDHRKLEGFLEELNYLLTKMKDIQNILIPDLEKIFHLEFKTPELILIAFSRPSIRNIYDDLEKFFKLRSGNPLKPDDYRELSASGEAANVLALIGDSAIDLGVVETLWDSSLATVDHLTKKRIEIVSNENLSKICDKWNLYNYRLNRYIDPSGIKAKEKSIIHEKGTLIEAIYGIIYLEFGFEVLLRTLPLIQ